MSRPQWDNIPCPDKAKDGRQCMCVCFKCLRTGRWQQPLSKVAIVRAHFEKFDSPCQASYCRITATSIFLPPLPAAARDWLVAHMQAAVADDAEDSGDLALAGGAQYLDQSLLDLSGL